MTTSFGRGAAVVVGATVVVVVDGSEVDSTAVVLAVELVVVVDDVTGSAWLRPAEQADTIRATTSRTARRRRIPEACEPYCAQDGESLASG